MAEEVVLTRFTADISELEAAVAQYETELGGATKASDKLDASTKTLGASVGNVSTKFDLVKQSAERTSKSIGNVANETRKAGASGGALGKLQGAFSSIGTSLKNAGSNVKGFFSGIIDGASNAIPGLSGITSSFSGMAGPIGIAAAAVGGFIANFSRLDSVQVFFDAVKIGLNTIGDRLANLDFRGFFDPSVMQQDAINAARQAAALDAIFDVQLKINKANAEAEKQIAGLNQQLRDRTKTDEERLAIADQITSIETKRAKEENTPSTIANGLA